MPSGSDYSGSGGIPTETGSDDTVDGETPVESEVDCLNKGDWVNPFERLCESAWNPSLWAGILIDKFVTPAQKNIMPKKFMSQLQLFTTHE